MPILMPSPCRKQRSGIGARVMDLKTVSSEASLASERFSTSELKPLAQVPFPLSTDSKVVSVMTCWKPSTGELFKIKTMSSKHIVKRKKGQTL